MNKVDDANRAELAQASGSMNDIMLELKAKLVAEMVGYSYTNSDCNEVHIWRIFFSFSNCLLILISKSTKPHLTTENSGPVQPRSQQAQNDAGVYQLSLSCLSV